MPCRPALLPCRKRREVTEGPWETEREGGFLLLLLHLPSFSPPAAATCGCPLARRGTIWPSEERRSQGRTGIPGKPMLQRRLVVLPPLLAAVLVTVAGVRRDSEYSGQYSLAPPSLGPSPPRSTYLTPRAAAERNICFKFEACLCATLCGLSQCWNARGRHRCRRLHFKGDSCLSVLVKFLLCPPP